MSEIRILGADAGQQRAWLFSRLSEGRKDGRTAVVFVPEQYTLQTERDLLTGMHLPGLLNLDVVSPSRLKTMVRETAGSSGRDELDDTGRAMAIHRALYACEKDLVYYQRLGSLYGAVPRMDQTLRELQEE
jgi:ATP-dependent helicase/nuclease subunit B